MTVEVQKVYRSFRGVTALDGIDLAVRAGEFLALLGPSGSGKTTLLRVLAGLDFADSGRIVINGRDMMGVPARQRRIGFVFQHYALFRHMSVARNIAFGLSVRPHSSRPPKAAIRARVDELLQMMGIPELADRMPHEISGGQRQRVALARALAIEPELLLLGEPFGALDAKVRHNLRLWLRELHDRMGLTSVFVTHDQSEAMQMADRVAVMRSGRIEQVDTPDHLYAEPASPFVYEFLGESVRLSCTVEGGLALFDSLPLPPLQTVCEPGPAVALIRPHEIRLTDEAGPGTVELVQAAGALIGEPGVIVHTGTVQKLAFGELDGTRSARAEEFLQACNEAGVEAELSDDINRLIWQKFVFLVGLSATTTSMRQPIGPIRSDPRTRGFLLDLMREVPAVARAAGVDLPADYAEGQLAACDRLPAEMTSSMHQDLKRGNRLELPWLSGHVIALGTETKVSTPCNRAVTDILALYENGGQGSNARALPH